MTAGSTPEGRDGSGRPRLTIQWHVTSQCGNRCRHCYMSDAGTREAESRPPLRYAGMRVVLDALTEFEQKWGFNIAHFAITGGDPLLHPDWPLLLGELRRRGKTFSLMGNPETLTADVAARLNDLGVRSFQFSLDGLEYSHDHLRSPGSFSRTCHALERLHANGIIGTLMFTLLPENAQQLVPALRYAATQTAAAGFDFDVGCMAGHAQQIGQRVTMDGFRGLLSEYLAEKERLEMAGCRLRVGEKPNLLKLARFSRGTFCPVPSGGMPTVSGCLCGWSGAAVLPDGSVMGCRRLPIVIGSLPQQPFDSIFLGSPLLRRFRRRASFRSCANCGFYAYCRGCPAYVYSLTGDPFAPDPLCFRSRVCEETPPPSNMDEPPLDASDKDEAHWIARRFSVSQSVRVSGLLRDERVQRLFLTLATSPEKRRRYLADPRSYISDTDAEIAPEAHVFLVMHLMQTPLGSDGSGDALATSVVDLMLRQEPRTRKPGLRQLLVRALEDDSFRAQLLAQPRAVIERTLGIRLPPQMNIHVHQQARDDLHIVLPAAPWTPGATE